MVGYDKSRFVCLTQSEEDELTCGICLAILNRPSVVPCCRQTYCQECIVEWLTAQECCPNDRQRLTVSQLYAPQRLVINLLSGLRVRCLFDANGCPAVSPLRSVSAHEDRCHYNPDRKCSDCGQTLSESTHNCVNSLKAQNKSLTEETTRLRSEILVLESRIKSLKENNGYNNTEYAHINQVMASARTRISCPDVTYCCIGSDTRTTAINKSKEAINGFDTFADIWHFLDRELNGHDSVTLSSGGHDSVTPSSGGHDSVTTSSGAHDWHIVVQALGCGQSSVRDQNGYIDLIFGQLRIVILSAGTANKTSSAGLRLSSEDHFNYDELKR